MTSLDVSYAAAAPQRRSPFERMQAAAAFSLLLHTALLLLFFCRLPWPEATEAAIVPLNLVTLTDGATRAGGGDTPASPQERAPETADMPDPRAVPLAGTPPPPAAAQSGPARSAPDIIAAVTPAPRPAVAKPLKSAALAAQSATPVPRAPSPDESLALKLKILARQTQPAPPLPSHPSQQDGAGWSNVSSAGGAGGAARHAAYSVKDLIRQQVERRWHVPPDRAGAAAWSVSIHIVLDADGTVDRAEIVPDPRLGADKDWLDFARSARNAVYTSSPIVLPAEGYALARDIVVDFDPKKVAQ